MRIPKANRKGSFARAGAIVAAVALGTALSAGVAFADTDATVSPALQESLRTGLHTDYSSVSDGADLASTEFPSAFDLRHYGGAVTYNAGDKQSTITGGWSYVAEVKAQDPLGTCWAFSLTSASETSMVSALDKNDDGQLNGSIDYEKAASGEAGALAQSASNLSERHLAYFAFAHPTTYGIYPEQAGEGQYLLSGSTDAFTMMNVGGTQMLGLSIYTSGHGPIPESYAPYISNEGWISAKGIQGDFSDSTSTLVDKYFLSYKEAKAFVDETWTAENVAAYNKSHNKSYTTVTFTPRVAKIGTWAVDDSLQYGTVAELDNSNIIAVDKDETTGKLNDTSMAQAKQELASGHSLSISFCADTSTPGQDLSGKKTYLNLSTWAQYTYEAATPNHAVTVVGYDDNYSKDNFTHEILNEDGTVNTEETDKTTPAGDGAWIVRNSWGSADNSNPLYVKNWGVENTGYFYLSYYDKSVSNIESYDFDLSTEAQSRSSYIAYQHDLAEAAQTQSLGDSNETKLSNVFDGPEEDEGFVAIRDLGYLTGSPDATTTLEVYVMDDSADTAATIAQGKPAATVADDTQANAGFHRIHLDTPVIVGPNQKFAVVQTTKRDDGDYECSYGRGVTRDYMSAYVNLMKKINPSFDSSEMQYFTAVVNKGESIIYTDGKWQEWSDVSKSIDQILLKQLLANTQTEIDQMREQLKKLTPGTEEYEKLQKQIDAEQDFIDNPPASMYAADNFMIKAYADEVDDATEVFSDVEAGQWYTDSVQKVYGMGIMTGYKDTEGNPTTFGTHDVLTRAQAAAVLYNMAGKGATAEGGKFSDVSDGAWYANAVNWAAEQGIVSGYGDGTFGPDDQVTREQLACMLKAMADKGLIDVPTTYDEKALDSFPDKGGVSSWAAEAMQWAVSNKVLSGVEKDGTRYLQPKTSSERCVMAAMVSNVLG